MKKQAEPSSTSMTKIVDGFECMDDIEILNKVKHKSNTTI